MSDIKGAIAGAAVTLVVVGLGGFFSNGWLVGQFGGLRAADFDKQMSDFAYALCKEEAKSADFNPKECFDEIDKRLAGRVELSSDQRSSMIEDWAGTHSASIADAMIDRHKTDVADAFWKKHRTELVSAVDLPDNVVIASVIRCEDFGWKQFKPAIGRMIVGAGDAEDSTYGEKLSDRPVWTEDATAPSPSIGGEEKVALTDPAQMPEHRHSIPMASFPSGFNLTDIGDAGNAAYLDYRTRSDVGIKILMSRETEGVGSAGGRKPHNNMPPYIALYFCKKD